MGEHLRCQVEYSKGFENYVDALVEDIKPITEIDEVQDFYFFWQDHSEKFERHIQLDLVLGPELDTQDFKDKVDEKLDQFERNHYWEDDFLDTWYALNQKESELLLDSRMRNADIALKALVAYREGELEHRPSDLVARNFHLTANQHGMTHWDEFKFCFKRAVEIPFIQLTHSLGIGVIYDKIFLRELD